MRSLLDAIGYGQWILPVLLLLPLGIGLRFAFDLDRLGWQVVVEGEWLPDFGVVGMNKGRTGTRQLDALGGPARALPRLSAVVAFAALASLELTGTAGFVGEFPGLVGAWKASTLLAILAAAGGVLGAVYVLRALQRVICDPLGDLAWRALPDLTRRKVSVPGTLSMLVPWLGVHPGPVLRRLEPDAVRFLELTTRGAPPSPPILLP